MEFGKAVTEIRENKIEDLNSLILMQIQSVIKEYLDNRSNLSLNALSKRCEVSEPTLRRIMKGHVKTLPNSSTILDILTTISGEKNLGQLSKLYPEPLSSYLKEALPQAQDLELSYDPDLNFELKHPTTYLIYKLASNSSGVCEKKISELFGANGLVLLKDLINKKYIVQNGDKFYASTKNFSANTQEFVQNFKALANFIKTSRRVEDSLLNPFFINYSESVSKEAYKEIVKIQKEALDKVRQVMSSPKSAGNVPFFLLLSIDTLDVKAAYEL